MHLLPGLPQAAASLAWSYSTLRYDHAELYECIAQAVLDMLGRDSTQSSGGCSGGGSGTVSGTDTSAVGSKAKHGGSEAGGAAFLPQTVSVLLFAFAAANRCDSPAQHKVRSPREGCAAARRSCLRSRAAYLPMRRGLESRRHVGTLGGGRRAQRGPCALPQMMTALAELADDLLLKFTPQGLANLAWGLTVAGIYPPQVGAAPLWVPLLGGCCAVVSASARWVLRSCGCCARWVLRCCACLPGVVAAGLPGTPRQLPRGCDSPGRTLAQPRLLTCSFTQPAALPAPLAAGAALAGRGGR